MTNRYVGNEPVGGKRGRIVRVKMTNFVTYESVECFPGQGLNVVIGPNGSGKSTLLCAIVLGLGGKPSVIGRSPSVQDYIKTNCHEARIEIELQGEKKNDVLKRTILRDGRSLWLLNDRTVTFKEFEKLTKSLNIQIDNLCQVLPQDRVQDFAKMNQQQLLDSTQKAVGQESMSAVHANLKELQRQQKAIDSSLIQDRSKEEQEQGHVNRLQGYVEKHEKRQSILKEVEICRSKLETLKYTAKKDEYLRYKKQKAEVSENIRAIREKIEPFEKQIKEATKKHNEIRNRHSGMDRRVQVALTELDAKEKALETKRHEIIDAENVKESKLQYAAKQRGDIEKLKLKIGRLRTDIASAQQMPKEEREQKIAVLQKAMDELARQVSDLRQQIFQIEGSLAQDNEALNEVTRRQRVLENVRDNRLRMLQQNNRDVYKAAMWIESNRDRFEKNVYLPMCVELNVLQPQFARYVEASIGGGDLVAISCESKADFGLIVEELRTRQRLSINVLHVEPMPDTFRPSMDIDTLNNICPGFHGYLRDFVTGPPTLITWLCKQKGFHRIPIGSDSVNPDKVPTEFNFYYCGDTRRTIGRSKYSGEIYKLCDSIDNARFLVDASDPQELQSLNDRATNLRRSVETSTEKINQLKSRFKELESNRNNKRSELNKIQTQQSTYETQRFQLAQKERELRSMEANVTDPQRVMEEFTLTVQKRVNELIELQEPYYKSLKLLEKCVRDSQVLQFTVQAAAHNVKVQKQKCKHEQDALDRALTTLEELNNAVADLKTEAKRLLNAFERRTGIKMDVFHTQQEDVLKTLPSSQEELEMHIEEKLARAEMLGSANGEMVREYENHVKRVSDLRAQIAIKEAKSASLVSQMTEQQNEWKTELTALVNKINENFSNYFRSMGCAGAVELFTGSSEHDYDNYGLKVRVKFRDNDELQDLNAFTQSGGERAVTTAIYMLSLQELTPVPFRLVDEINQGMDAINERKVLELLLTSTSRPETPQYFLLTPKLLKDMPYSDNTTVLCIINSACAPNYRYWDVNKYIQLRRERNANRHVECDDDD